MSSGIEHEPKPKPKLAVKNNMVFYVKKGKECLPIPFINDILYIADPNTRKFRTLSAVVNYIRRSEYPVLVVYQRDEKYPMYIGIPYEHLQAIKYGASILQILVNVPKFGQQSYLKLILNREVQPMTYWDIFPPTDWTGLHSINHPGFRYIISQLVAEYISEEGVEIHNTFINDILESAKGYAMYDSKANQKRSKYQYLKQLQDAIHPMVLFTPTHEFFGLSPEFCERCGGILNPITKSCYSC